LDKSDLENQIGVFDNKIEMLKEKAKALLDRAKNSETHIEQLPDIAMRFGEIQERFRRGVYQELIVGELERNYIQIKDMYNKLQREEKEDQNLAEKLA
jgi:predicted RNase H-like nuclease (RuvC/YqgF family)